MANRDISRIICFLLACMPSLGASQTVVDGDNILARIYPINDWNMFTTEKMSFAVPNVPPQDKIVSFKVLIYSDTKNGRKTEVFPLTRMTGAKNYVAGGPQPQYPKKSGGWFTLEHYGTSLNFFLSRGPCRRGDSEPCTETRSGNHDFFTYAGPFGPANGASRTFKAGGVRGAILVEYLP